MRMYGQALSDLHVKYQELLKKEDSKLIRQVLDFFEYRARVVKDGKVESFEQSVNLLLDDDGKRILELMDAFSKEIKDIFMRSEESIIHITNISPENLIGGKLRRSLNIPNNYETDVGNWVFASSEPLDSTNAYMARKPGYGMMTITPELYVFSGDNIDVIKDEQGKNRAVLKEPNYVYRINPSTFKPVVILNIDKKGEPYFEFSEEWISEEEMYIDNPDHIRGVDIISDVTVLLENYQILCDVDMQGIAMKARRAARNSKEECLQVIKDAIKDGSLRYINREVGINDRPTLKIDMHLDEFEPQMQKIVMSQNQKLQGIDPSKIKAYKLLVEYRKIRNSLELNGTFRKDLAVQKTQDEIDANRSACEEQFARILEEARALFGADITLDNIESILLLQAQEVIVLIQECKAELKDTAKDADLTINSCIYVSPSQLIDGKLQTSKQVLNLVGEIGDWVFAQSCSLVDNPYLLRKSGQGVFCVGNICMPGTPNLVLERNGRAILSEPVYVYLMKTEQFEPVVTVKYAEDGKPVIYFEGEWTSEQDIDSKDMQVKRFSDVTEMLEHMQIFSAEDKETFLEIVNLMEGNALGGVAKLIQSGRLHYINGECGINVSPKLIKMYKDLTGPGGEWPGNRF